MKDHYAEYGVAVRIHKNTGRLPTIALTYEEQLNIANLLMKTTPCFFPAEFLTIKEMISSYCHQVAVI